MNIASTYILVLCIVSLMVSSKTMSQTANELKKSDLPQAVKAQLDRKYRGYEIISLEKKIDTLNGNTFEIEVQRNSKVIFLVFDNEGQRISTAKSKAFTFDGTEPVRKPSSTHKNHNHTH